MKLQLLCDSPLRLRASFRRCALLTLSSLALIGVTQCAAPIAQSDVAVEDASSSSDRPQPVALCLQRGGQCVPFVATGANPAYSVNCENPRILADGRISAFGNGPQPQLSLGCDDALEDGANNFYGCCLVPGR